MPKQTPKNFNLQRELDERSENDWLFGAMSQPSLVSIPETERDQYLPVGETQFDQFADFTDCASRSPVNHLEALFTYHYQHKMLPENKLWMEQNGYVQGSKVTFSDRFIAVLSGTTHDGNSLWSPINTIRTKGLIPKKLLPKEEWMQWSDYYDSSKITPFLNDLGQEFLKRFTISYEQVAQIHFDDVLKDDMLGVAGFAWPKAVDGVYPPTDGQFNHAFLVYKHPKWQAFDNYFETPGDFTKNLSPMYKFYDFAYRVYVSKETSPTQVISLYQQLVEALKQLLVNMQTTNPATPPVVPPAPPKPPVPISAAEALYNAAYASRGKDLSKSAPNELGCAESLSRVIRMIYPDFPIILSTAGLNLKLKDSYHFVASPNPIKGAVTIFPTQGSKVGHAGIWGKAYVMSNTSATGKWEANYTLAAWIAEAKKRGLPLFHYIPVTTPFGSKGVSITNQSQPFMDSSITSAIVIVIGAFLALFHINFAGDLTQVVTAVVTLAAAAMVWYQRTTLTKAPNGIGDVTTFGAARK